MAKTVNVISSETSPPEKSRANPYYAGKWITGPTGANRLAQLATDLEGKTLEKANRFLGASYSSYAPWMSCESRLTFFHEHQALTSELVAVQRQFPLGEKRLLAFLDQAFRSEAHFSQGSSPRLELPMEALGVREDNGFCIELADQGRIKTFLELIPKSVTRLRGTSPGFSKMLDSLVHQFIPIGLGSDVAQRREEGRGLSTHLYRGGIFLDLPELSDPIHRELELTICIAHELGHHALMVYQNADPLLESSFDTPVYSAIRKTERPAIKSVHALAALGLMLEYVIRALKQGTTTQAENDYLGQRRSELSSLLNQGLRALEEARIRTTPVGTLLLEELRNLEVGLLLESSSIERGV